MRECTQNGPSDDRCHCRVRISGFRFFNSLELDELGCCQKTRVCSSQEEIINHVSAYERRAVVKLHTNFQPFIDFEEEDRMAGTLYYLCVCFASLNWFVLGAIDGFRCVCIHIAHLGYSVRFLLRGLLQAFICLLPLF